MMKAIRKSKVAKILLTVAFVGISFLTFSYPQTTAYVVSATFLSASLILIGTMI
jgi:hypothetical protein